MSHITRSLRPVVRQHLRPTISHQQPQIRTMSASAPRAAADWSAKQYAKFLDERTRPARDLLARVPLAAPKRIIDLGCGPGNSTAVLAERYPDADLSGVDSSPDMIRQAKETLPDVPFSIADLQTFRPDGPVDLLYSNAVFQWLPGHDRVRIITELVASLNPGGSLAFQVPNNLSQPSHAAMREAAFAPGTSWEATMRRANPGRDEFQTHVELYDALSPLCSTVDIWETKYFHTLENHEAIVEWVKGTGLRPFVDPLSDSEREGFLAEYLERLREAYPSQKDGKVLLPYPRLFVVATKS
ncbi:S-adenosyl-L-methionine-dependent methyltransferase [Plectosphaerella cucumerina]|uniref:S-adenosyl-L-methionine-dependent methyltransferase n=1 Tax=Plectosphaerella cucumerina TaxID=40658 RepID=A0A8K0TGZ6_9PEZI|nr:S-adenosyl-L-methionine-dependent methyltransferase [Plectosphaerella cucumerina]